MFEATPQGQRRFAVKARNQKTLFRRPISIGIQTKALSMGQRCDERLQVRIATPVFFQIQ